MGSAGDVECMYVKAKQPMMHIKKKARKEYAGTTASMLYPNVKRPSYKSLTQVDARTKGVIFGDLECPKVNGDSLVPS